MRHGQRNESGRGEEGVAAMKAAAVSSCGRRAADDAMSQTAGQRTMQRERAVTTTAIDWSGWQILQRKQAADDEWWMKGGGWRTMTAGNTRRGMGRGGEEAVS